MSVIFVTYIFSSRLEVFDSLSVDAEKLNNLKIYCRLKGIKTIKYNETPFQLENSESCGLFVIYFIWQRMFNLDLSFDEILEESFFSDNHLNEIKVKEFCEKLEEDIN